jgi:hypothetical protein
MQLAPQIKQLILPLKMVTRSIPYVSKPTNQKFCNKLLSKNMPKKFEAFDSSQQIE